MSQVRILPEALCDVWVVSRPEGITQQIERTACRWTPCTDAIGARAMLPDDGSRIRRTATSLSAIRGPRSQPAPGWLLHVAEQRPREQHAHGGDHQLAVQLQTRTERKGAVVEGVAKQLEQRYVHQVQRKRDAAAEDHRTGASQPDARVSRGMSSRAAAKSKAPPLNSLASRASHMYGAGWVWATAVHTSVGTRTSPASAATAPGPAYRRSRQTTIASAGKHR